MKNAKLVYFLGLLSPRERKDFRKFVASPIFNERDVLGRLLTILEKNCFDNRKKCSPQYVYELLYEGERPFNEASLKTSMSQLLGLLRDGRPNLLPSEDAAINSNDKVVLIANSRPAFA